MSKSFAFCEKIENFAGSDLFIKSPNLSQTTYKRIIKHSIPTPSFQISPKHQRYSGPSWLTNKQKFGKKRSFF
jgi:hypothetical protein